MSRRSQVGASLLFLVAGLALPAKADSLAWGNSSGGLVSLPGNWSPNQVPGASDDLVFNLNSTYGVTFGAAVATTHSQAYRAGTVSVTTSALHTATNGIVIGQGVFDSATMNLVSGLFHAGNFSTIGQASSATGTLNVSSAGASFTQDGNLFVGGAGTGNLNITGGGFVQVEDLLLTGTQASATGTVIVSGARSSPVQQSSALVVQGQGESRLGQLGDSSLTVTRGALASFGGPLVVGHGSSSVSTIAVLTAETVGAVNPHMFLSSDMLLGKNTVAGLAAGSGSLTLGPDSEVRVMGTTYVGGDPDGGTGALHMDGEFASLRTHSLAIGAGGSLTATGGIITVDGGSLSYTHPSAPFVLGSTGTTLHTILKGGATATLTPPFPAAPALTVGGGTGFAARFADIDLQTNSTITVPSGDVIIGDKANDSGVIDIAWGSINFGSPSAKLSIGKSGFGQVYAGFGGLSSAHITGSTIFVGELTGSEGVLGISGSDATVQAQALAIGGGASTWGGSGALHITSGGAVTVSGGDDPFRVWLTGSLEVTDGSITSTNGRATIDGPYTITNGTINAPDIWFGEDGSASGLLNGPVFIIQESVMTLNGDLSAGSTAVNTGFSNQGTVLVQQHTLTLFDKNEAALNTCVIGPGGKVIAENGVLIGTGKTLSGAGTVDADVLNSGAILSGGTGLIFNGIVNGVGEGITGQTTHYLLGGGFTGQGTIATPIDADAQAVFTATGPLTMGQAGNQLGVVFGGTLHCGNSAVSLLDSNGLGLGVLTDIAGGSLNCSQNLSVSGGRVVEGYGTVSTPTLTVFGSVVVGDTPGHAGATGLLNIAGNLTLGGAAEYTVELAPFDDTPQHDRTGVSGTAALNGHVTVGLIPGYTPNARDTFDIVIAGTRTGQFTSQTMPNVGGFGPAHIVYSPTKATVVMCYANCDGSAASPVLTANDFQCYLNRFAAGEPYANCDGSTATPALTANDFQCFLNKFSQGCS